MHSTQNCTEVSEFCPVGATVLGYYPNVGSNIFFAIAFAAVLIGSVVQGVWKRTWTYAAAICAGLIMEVCGYVGRVLLHKNPWNQGAFEMEICCIILAPTFICISIYLTLKHVALALNPGLSRVRPRWYPIIFLPADLSCLIVQGIGGGLATAAGHHNPSLLKGGNDAIIAGVGLQVAVLCVFGVLGTDYFFRVRKYMRSGEADEAALAVWRDAKFRRFALGVMVAYSCILLRCIYRIAEMAGGWGNPIMQDEPSFLVLDSTLVLVATSLLTIFHPGFNFPQMSNGYRKKMRGEKVSTEPNESSNESTEGPKVGTPEP